MAEMIRTLLAWSGEGGIDGDFYLAYMFLSIMGLIAFISYLCLLGWTYRKNTYTVFIVCSCCIFLSFGMDRITGDQSSWKPVLIGVAIGLALQGIRLLNYRGY